MQSQHHQANAMMMIITSSNHIVDDRSEQGDVQKNLHVHAFDAA